MSKVFKPGARVDSRKRRRFFRLLKKIERISAVVLVWLLFASLLYGFYDLVFMQPYFAVREINVKGEMAHVSTDDIKTLANVTEGEHLLRISVSDIQKRILGNSWIKEVAVHRKLPHMLLIYVKEYVPEAMVKLTDGLYFVNKQGTAFKKIDITDDKNFPVITGLEELNPAEQPFASKVIEALKLKRLFEASEIGEIYGLSEISCSEEKGLSIVTQNDPMEVRLGFGSFLEKLERIDTVYSAMRSHGGVASYMDLSPEGKVVVKYGT